MKPGVKKTLCASEDDWKLVIGGKWQDDEANTLKHHTKHMLQ